jgi:hypothetical protein
MQARKDSKAGKTILKGRQGKKSIGGRQEKTQRKIGKERLKEKLRDGQERTQWPASCGNCLCDYDANVRYSES